jgi:hypothetical protein
VLQATDLTGFDSKIDLFDDLQQLLSQAFRGEFEVPIPQDIKDMLGPWLSVANLVGIGREIATAIDEWDPQRVSQSRQLSADLCRGGVLRDIPAEERPLAGDALIQLRARLSELRKLLPVWQPGEVPDAGRRGVAALFDVFCNEIQKIGPLSDQVINDVLMGPVADAFNRILDAYDASARDFDGPFGEASRLMETVPGHEHLKEELRALQREHQRRKEEQRHAIPDLTGKIKGVRERIGPKLEGTRAVVAKLAPLKKLLEKASRSGGQKGAGSRPAID